MGNKYDKVVLLLCFNVLVSIIETQNITTCDSGTFFSHSEDRDTCLTCPEGTFMSLKNHTKKKCDDCTKLEDPTSELLITPCVSTRDADIQCVEGYFRQLARSLNDMPFCIKCTRTCPKGHVQVHLCQNFTDLGCCPGENYDYAVNENGIPYCRERPVMCRRGQFLDTQVNDCKPCPNRTFMSENYHSYTQCWDCQNKSEADLPLHSRIIQICTKTQPSVYGCKVGFHISSRLHVASCLPCQTCDKGKYVGRQCDMYHDTVCCDKPNMIVENGSQRESCVVEDRKDVGGEADDSTSVRWVIPMLVIICVLLIVGIICVINKKRLRKLVQDTFLRRKRGARCDDGTMIKVLIDTSLQSKIQELETDKKNLTGEEETVASENATLLSKNQELEADKTKLTEEIKEKDNKLESVKNENEADKTKLTEEIKEKDNKLESVKSENATLQSKNQELEADKTKLTEEIKEKGNKLESVGSENATLLSKNQELEADKTKLTEEIKEKDNKLESVKNENATLQSKNQELEADKTKLTEEIKEKDNKLESVKNENATLQSKNQELETDKTKLTEKIKENNREMETVQREKKTLQTKIWELDAEITKLTKLNFNVDKRNREMETVGGEKGRGDTEKQHE